MKKRAIFLTILTAVGAFFMPSTAAYADDMPYIQSMTAVVIEADTGTVLYNKNKDKQMHPASITKLMTAMLALENLDTDEVMTTSHNAVYSLPYNTSHIALFENEKITVEQALYALGIESANDASNVIAEHISGSNEAFGRLMTERARELGAYNTSFVNPHGLPDDNHYTTAYDMALIARAAIKLEGYRKYFSTNRYDMGPTNERDETRQFWNANYFINGYESCEGLIISKTGWTQEAKHTLVTAAERNGTTLIAVVMYSDGQGTKYDDTTALLDHCFASYKKGKITAEIIADRVPDTISTYEGNEFSVPKSDFLPEGFDIVLPADKTEHDIELRFSSARLNSDGNIAAMDVEAYFEQNGRDILCGEGQLSAIVNGDLKAAKRALFWTKVKRALLIGVEIFLWLLVALVVFVALKQLVIIENRRRIREKKRRIAQAKRRKALQNHNDNE